MTGVGVNWGHVSPARQIVSQCQFHTLRMRNRVETFAQSGDNDELSMRPHQGVSFAYFRVFQKAPHEFHHPPPR